MSKKAARAGWRHYTASSRPVTSAPQPTLDRLSAWIGRRSRLVRSILAGLIALTLTGALGLVLYTFLFSLSPASLNFGPINENNILPASLTVLLVIGVVFYGIGWRLLIGFDLGRATVQPGRSAANWLLFGTIVFCVTVFLVIWAAATAAAP